MSQKRLSAVGAKRNFTLSGLAMGTTDFHVRPVVPNVADRMLPVDVAEDLLPVVIETT